MSKAFHKILLVLLLVAAPAAAQITRPGVPGENRDSAKDRVRQAYQSARWQLGPLKLEPRLSISDVGYVSNIYSTTESKSKSDLRARASAGLHSFFNLGPKVMVSPFAELEYSWWQEQEDLRSTTESFGLRIFGDLNRVQLQFQAGQVGTQRNLSSEVEVPVDRENGRVELVFEIDFWGPLRMFGTAAENRLRYSGTAAEGQVPNLDLALLESDGELLRVGLDYELGSALVIGVGYQQAETTYLIDPGGRSNKGSGPLARVSFQGSRLGLELDVTRQDLELFGRETGKRRQTTGHSRIDWKLTQRLSATLYGSLRLDASALDGDAIFESQRAGLSLAHRPGTRTQIGAFYEVGEDAFATVASDQVTRVDEFRIRGVTLQRRITPRLSVTLGYNDTQRDSPDPQFNRSFRSLVSRISLGGDLLPW